MKIYYANNLEIIKVVFDRDSYVTKSPSGSFNIFEIDEIDPDNKDVSLDIVNMQRRKDVNGLQKYHMIENAGVIELHQRDGWEEDVIV